MRAIRLLQGQATFVKNHPVPRLKPGEVLLKVLKSGICETDLQLIRGYMSFEGTLGHEFVAVPESGKFAGERVACEINCSCHDCPTCQAGFPTHCPHRTVIGIYKHDGAFAEYVSAPERNLHPIPDSVCDEAAVFVEPVAAACQIPSQIPDISGKQIVVLGDGRLGNLCAQVLKQAGANVLLVGKHPWKLKLAAGLGIRTELLSELQIWRFADIAVDATGSASGFDVACRVVKPRGIVVLKTTLAGNQGPNLASVVIDEITVVGSRCGPFPRAIDALRNQEIAVLPMITESFPLEQGIEALKLAGAPGAMKVLLDINPAGGSLEETVRVG